jgi:hypothetical protein
MSKSEQPWTEETEWWVLGSKPKLKLIDLHTKSPPEPHPWEEDTDETDKLCVKDIKWYEGVTPIQILQRGSISLDE